MRHSYITLLIITSILFVGVENVVDELLDDHALSSSHSHMQTQDEHLASDDHDTDTHHCGHCFHSHAGDVVDSIESSVLRATIGLLTHREPNLLAYLQAPPTPPPNA